MRHKFSKLLVATLILSVASGQLSAGATDTTGSAATQEEQTKATAFADLHSASEWARVSIEQAQELGLMLGDADGKFRPHNTISRQEMAVLLSRLLQLPPNEDHATTFRDVQAEWALEAVEAVRLEGIMKGDGNGRFRPLDGVTREELAALLVRAAGIDPTGKGASLTVADKASISAWAQDSVAAALELGLLKGDGTRFNPKGQATREEVAAVIVRFVDRQVPRVEAVTADGVTVKGVTYRVGDALQPLFTAENEAILLGAILKFETEGDTITKITSLEITAGGEAAAEGEAEFSGNLVLDGGQAAIGGDVTVRANYVTLQNLTINGNLVISEELENDFYSDNLTVTGETAVNGGDTNTVVFANASLGGMTVNKPNVRVEPTGHTTIGEVTVTANATITADSGVTLPKLTLTAGAQSVEVNAHVTDLVVTGSRATTLSGNGTIGTLHLTGTQPLTLNTTGRIEKVEVSDKGGKLTLNPGASVGNLVLPDGVTATEAVTNYTTVLNQIPQVTTPSGTTYNGGTSSGGSGSSAPAPAPAPTPTPTPAPTPEQQAEQMRTELQNLIIEAQQLIDTTRNGTAEGYYMEYAINDLERSITEQTVVANNTAATYQELWHAHNDLSVFIMFYHDAFIAWDLEQERNKLSMDLTSRKNWVQYDRVGTAEEQYPQAAYDAYQLVLTDAETVLNKVDVTAQELYAADQRLLSAYETYRSSQVFTLEGQHQLLQATIDSAKQSVAMTVEGTEPNQYRPGAKQALQDAVDAATAVQATEGVTPAQLQSARWALQNAVTQHRLMRIDRTIEHAKPELLARINESQAELDQAPKGEGDGQFPQTAVDTFQAAIDTAMTVYQKEQATVSEVDTAKQTLINAGITFQESIVFTAEGRRSHLGSMINHHQTEVDAAVEGSESGQYPAGAKQAFQEALTAAAQVQQNAAATVEELQAAIAALSSAAYDFSQTVNP